MREVFCILGDKDMFSILVQLIGTFWVISALIQLASALRLKGSTETVIQFLCTDRKDDESDYEG